MRPSDPPPVVPTRSESAASKGRRTAGRILDAAELLFAAQGYAATSLRDIAAVARIQQPGLYKHFSSKEDLYRNVYERALRPMTELMESILVGPDETFGELTDKMTDLLAQHPNIARLLVRAAISPAADRDEVALAWLDRLVDYGRKLNSKAGTLSDDGTLAVHIVAIFNMLFGFFWAAPLIEHLAGRPGAEPDIMDQQKQLLRRFVAAMAADSTASAGIAQGAAAAR